MLLILSIFLYLSFEFTPHGGSEETTTTTGEDDAGGGECVLTAETAVPLGNGQLKQRPGTDYYEKICVSQPPPKESNNNNGNKPADGEAGYGWEYILLLNLHFYRFIVFV
jgi:hypothetical protein